MLDVTSSKHDPYLKIKKNKEFQFSGSSHQNCTIFALTGQQLVPVDSTY
jgi:hypothetical protein